MTIIEFLEARIAEDENAARALLRDLEGQVQEEYAGAIDEKGPMTPARLLSAQMWAHYDGQSKRRSFAKGQQIATLANPTRALAECAAKRALLGVHHPHDHGGEHGDAVFCDECQWDHGDDSPRIDNQPVEGFGANPCRTLACIAAVYSDHPDYQQEWAA